MAKKPPTPAEKPAEPAPATEAPPLTGLALLQSLYAHPVSGEPTALQWRKSAPADRQVVVSKFGTLLFPNGDLAIFNQTEAQAVRRYLAALRPNDEIQLSNIS